jgi:hypothetical protein
MPLLLGAAFHQAALREVQLHGRHLQQQLSVHPQMGFAPLHTAHHHPQHWHPIWRSSCRLLEFAHEQAPACKDPSQAITAAASALLRDCSSGGEACAIDKYYALRPGAKEGCSVPPELAALAKGE